MREQALFSLDLRKRQSFCNKRSSPKSCGDPLCRNPRLPPPGSDQADFALRVKIPVLMINGRYDYVFSVEKAQDPLFAMLGTPAADKRHVLLDTPHDVTEQRPQLIHAVLDWLDKYLGRVNN